MKTCMCNSIFPLLIFNAIRLYECKCKYLVSLQCNSALDCKLLWITWNQNLKLTRNSINTNTPSIKWTQISALAINIFNICYCSEKNPWKSRNKFSIGSVILKIHQRILRKKYCETKTSLANSRESEPFWFQGENQLLYWTKYIGF